MIQHHFAEGVYAREQVLLAGETVETHAHKYDHLSIMMGGPVSVMCDGIEAIYNGPKCILIKAGVKHKIHAHGSSIWYCIHQSNETDIPALEASLIKE